MELLSPAGNYDKMVAAVTFGADAVYFGGPAFGLRAYAGNFSYDMMEEALKYLHDRGKKGYVTVNIYPSTEELVSIEDYLKRCENIGVDGLIISDPGVFSIAKKIGIKVPISISTQANTTNLAAVNFWGDLGAKRIVLARETTKREIEAICAGANCEIETFIHGAICISMSGRCLISSYMTGRSANKGECTHPCRWNYAIMEETRPGEYFPVYEDERGTYLYNSKDNCMLDQIGELIKIGVKSGKIEGRMKSVMYTSIVTGVYRAAINNALKNPNEYKSLQYWHQLLNSVSNRGYIEGYFNESQNADKLAINQNNSGYSRTADFLGVINSWSNNEINIACRSKFVIGDNISILTPSLERIDIKVEKIYNKDKILVDMSKPNYTFKLEVNQPIEKGSLLMRFNK